MLAVPSFSALGLALNVHAQPQLKPLNVIIFRAASTS